MSFAATLEYLRPGLDLFDAVILQDDGAGPYIAKWNDPRPQPTADEIAAAEVAASLAYDRTNMPPISRAQLRLELHARGLLATVESAVAGSNDVAVQIMWADSRDFHRSHPLLVSMLPVVGISDTLADEIFTAARSR